MTHQTASTSADNTLRIDAVPAARGSIGITFAPGKKQSNGLSGAHRRDLDADLDVIAGWGASTVVTLVTQSELRMLGISDLGTKVRQRFMTWRHFPVEDVQTPTAADEPAWELLSQDLRDLLSSGERILVHCRGGIGRACMVAGRLLVEMGADPEKAITALRQARHPNAVETREQEDWVRAGQTMAIKSALRGIDARDRALGSMLGLAVGDAVGTTLEFSAKPRQPALEDLVGGGPFSLKAGQWTDDTAMALALADSLIHEARLDPYDLMDRFVDWARNGSYSSTGTCFDIGVTTGRALNAYLRSGNPLAGSSDPEQAGNGSIMRLAPVAVRHWNDPAELDRVARLQSRTTHGADEAVEGAATLAALLAEAIAGRSLPELVEDHGPKVRSYRPAQPRHEVRGTGYVVACLHAALWAVARTSNFRDAVLMAANLGEDADTTAAVAGQIAGAIYGRSGIPAVWLEKLAWREEIQAKAAALFSATQSKPI